MHPKLKNWAHVHVFRVSTALVTILLLALGFFFHPDLLTWWLRTTMGLIEMASGQPPYPWGDQFKIALRSIGGHIWFQIALAINLVRMVAWFNAVTYKELSA